MVGRRESTDDPFHAMEQRTQLRHMPTIEDTQVPRLGF